MKNHLGHPLASEVRERREVNHALKDNIINARKGNPTMNRIAMPPKFFLLDNKQKKPIEQQKKKLK
jgi:hypothetical protein